MRAKFQSTREELLTAYLKKTIDFKATPDWSELLFDHLWKQFKVAYFKKTIDFKTPPDSNNFLTKDHVAEEFAAYTREFISEATADSSTLQTQNRINPSRLLI
jgi:hypothetical protein